MWEQGLEAMLAGLGLGRAVFRTAAIRHAACFEMRNDPATMPKMLPKQQFNDFFDTSLAIHSEDAGCIHLRMPLYFLESNGCKRSGAQGERKRASHSVESAHFRRQRGIAPRCGGR